MRALTITFTAAAILAAAVALPASCRAQGFAQNPAYQEFRGPITIRNMRPYQLLFLQFNPESPDTLKPGSSKYSLQFDVANNMLAPSRAGGSTVVEDNEEQRLLLTYHKGLTWAGGTEAAIFVPIVYRNGGFLDEVLRVWHRLLGTTVSNVDNPGGRESFSNYQSVLFVRDAGGNTLVNAGNAFGLGDVSFSLKKELTRSSKSTNLAARLALKLPTGNAGGILASGGADVGLCLDGRVKLGREIMIYANAGAAWASHATRVPNSRSFIPQGIVALEWRSNNRDSWIWQIDYSAAAVRTGSRVADDTQVTGSFGYKRVLNRNLTLHAAFSENGDVVDYAAKPIANIGPDFTTTIGLEWRH